MRSRQKDAVPGKVSLELRPPTHPFLPVFGLHDGDEAVLVSACQVNRV